MFHCQIQPLLTFLTDGHAGESHHCALACGQLGACEALEALLVRGDLPQDALAAGLFMLTRDWQFSSRHHRSN